MASHSVRLDRLVMVGLVAAWSLASPAVRAEDTATPVAQALFDDGRQLLLSHDYPAACAKLAASQRLEPAAGTLINLAFCHEQLGKTATAYVEYNDVLALSLKNDDTERIALARERIAALEPNLSWLLIVLPPGEQDDDVSVTLDGTFVGTDAVGAPIPIDVGLHRVAVARAGREVTVDAIVDQAGSTTQVDIPAFPPVWSLVPAPVQSRPTPPTASSAPSVRGTTPQPSVPAADSEREQRPRGSDSVPHMLTGGLLAVSVMALAAGTLFGLDAFSEWGKRNRHCPDGRCDQAAVDAHDRATRAATLSDTFFVLGAVTGALGVYWVTRSADGGTHSADRDRPNATVRSAMLAARGRF
jgi:hypothetical protein